MRRGRTAKGGEREGSVALPPFSSSILLELDLAAAGPEGATNERRAKAAGATLPLLLSSFFRDDRTRRVGSGNSTCDSIR